MTVDAKLSGGLDRLYLVLAASACFGLGVITLYSSGVGLVEPKFHRSSGFVLALIVGISVSRMRRQAGGTVAGSRAVIHGILDAAMLAAGMWSIWSFFSVQSQMERLYDVTLDASRHSPALSCSLSFAGACGDGVFLRRRLWSPLSDHGQDLPGIMAHTGFSLKEVAEALWYNTNKGVFGSITNIVLTPSSLHHLRGPA